MNELKGLRLKKKSLKDEQPKVERKIWKYIYHLHYLD